MSIASTIAALQPEEYSNVLMFLLETGALDALGQVAALVGDDDTLQEEPETDAVVRGECNDVCVEMKWCHFYGVTHSSISSPSPITTPHLPNCWWTVLVCMMS